MSEYIDLIIANLKKDNGQDFCPIIVSRNGFVIDGNQRVTAAIKAGVSSLPGIVIDADVIQIDISNLTRTWFSD